MKPSRTLTRLSFIDFITTMVALDSFQELTSDTELKASHQDNYSEYFKLADLDPNYQASRNLPIEKNWHQVKSLSRAESSENRAPCSGLEHISEVLARISAPLTGERRVDSGSGGGQPGVESTNNQSNQKPSPVTSFYPLYVLGGVANARERVFCWEVVSIGG